MRLNDFIRNWTDAVRPGLAVFPEVDVAELARRLKIDAKGRERGKADQPATSSSDLDPVELEIVSEVERIRRQGLNSYAEHLESYARRLRDAEAASTLADLRQAAQSAISDFQVLCGNARNALTNSRDHLNLCLRERTEFTKRHGTARPARPPSSLVVSLSLAAILLMVESAGNAYFFSAGNELGLLGGWFVAILVSVANVGFAGVAGYFARYLNHRSVFGKLAGILVVGTLLGVLAALNLSVAHFRDMLGTTAWQAAAEASLAKVLAEPFTLASVESWLLVGIGALVVLIAFWKGYGFDDPYPGYGPISRRLAVARDDYARMWSDWSSSLTALRDQSIDDLRAARTLVAETLRDEPNIRASRSVLAGQRDTFLGHCDAAAQRLLALYREANRAARRSPPPQHFAQPFRFEPMAAAEALNPGSGTRAAEAAEEVDRVVTESMTAIKDAHDAALAGLPLIEDIEKVVRDAPAW